MDILRDIGAFFKDDTEHNVRIQVDVLGITIYIEYDPQHDYEDKYVIPVRYDILEEFAYIPQSELVDIYNPDDYGIDLCEIEIIRNIMHYLENYKKEIESICSALDCGDRIKNNDNNSVVFERDDNENDIPLSVKYAEHSFA